MRALIICDNHGPFPQALLDRRPLGLMPVGGKTALQCILEPLARRGVKRATLAVIDHADYVMGLLGDGERWGMTLDYILPRSHKGLAETMGLMNLDPGEDLLVLPGLVLTDLSPEALLARRGDTGAPVAACWEGHGGLPGAEMLLLRPEHLALLPRQTAFPAQALANNPRAILLRQGAGLLLWDLQSYWLANRACLRGEPPFSGDGIQRGLRCRLHSRAELLAPVLVGDAVEVSAGCRVGPDAILGENCILDDGVEARECIILPGTFMGRNTTFSGVIADQGLLVSIPDGSTLFVPDPFILGPASALSLSGLFSELIQRGLAWLGILLASPLLGVMGLWGLIRPGLWTRRTVVVSREMETLGGQMRLVETEMHGLDVSCPLLAQLPALWNVARGELALVGVEPLSPGAVRELEGTWAEPRLNCRAGLVNPWHAQSPADIDATGRRVMELYYAKTQSLSEDMGILRKALGRLLRRDRT